MSNYSEEAAVKAELMKGNQIGKIPTYMEETHVLLHNPIIIINFC